MLLDLLRKDESVLAGVGATAIEQARLASVPVYYVDDDLGDGIIMQMPDGTRHLIEAGKDGDIILQTFAPR